MYIYYSFKERTTRDTGKHGYSVAVSSVEGAMPAFPAPRLLLGTDYGFPCPSLRPTVLIVEQAAFTFQLLELDVVAMARTPLPSGL